MIHPRTTTCRQSLLSCAALIFASSTLHAQSVWDGETDANASGNWSNALLWTDDLVPDAVTAELPDVTTGTRTVTVDTDNPSIAGLTINQTTPGAVNRLTIAGTGAGTVEDPLVPHTLNIALTGVAMNATRGEGVGVGGIVLNLENGGTLSASNTINGAKSMDFNGTLNLNGGAIRFLATTTNTSNTFNSLGALVSTGGQISASSSHLSTGAGMNFTLNLGSAEITTSTAAFNSGTTTIGRTADGDRSNVVVNNHGAASVANDAVLRLNNRQEANTGFGSLSATFDNKAGATLTLGDPNNAGSAQIRFTRDGSDNSLVGWNQTVTNSGTLSLFASSKIYNDNLGVPRTVTLNNNTGATLNLAGDATGVLIGGDLGNVDGRNNVTVNNAGEFDASLYPGATSGFVRIGTFGTATNARGTSAFNNNEGGVVTVAPDVTVLLRSRSGGSGGAANVLSNAAGAEITLGAPSSTTTGGKLQMEIFDAGSGSATSSFTNGGNLTLHGTSSQYSTRVSGDVTWTHTLTNQAGGVINLHDTSILGGSTVAASVAITTNFANAGTLNKHATGTASLYLGANGNLTNTGTIDVKAGSLSSTGALDASAASSVIKVGVGPAVAAPQVTTTGTMTYGGSLELVVNTATPAGVYNLFDSAAVAGAFANITLSGSGGFSGTAAGSSIFNGGFTFAFNGATGELTVTEGVPSFTPLEQWRIDNFGSATNSGDGADDFDFDFDGIDNLVEYATGTNPKSSSGSPITAGEAGGFLTVSFNRIADPALTYTVKAGNDLSGFPATIFTSTGVANVAGPVTATDTQPIAGNPKRFARLEVTY